MKRLLEITLACSAVFGGGAACAQGTVGNGTFQNLNFEGATLPNNSPPGFYPASEVLPGWNAYVEGSLQTSLFYNNFPLNGGAISLFSAADGALDGNYSLFLSGSVFPGPPLLSVTQSGTIPSGANSIQFTAQLAGSMFVYANGTSIPLHTLSSAGSVATYGGNISQFAGQNTVLQFSPGNPGWFILDDITFSSQGVPEPGELALAALGGLLMAISSRTRRR
jgi:hypothetical protein